MKIIFLDRWKEGLSVGRNQQTRKRRNEDSGELGSMYQEQKKSRSEGMDRRRRDRRVDTRGHGLFWEPCGRPGCGVRNGKVF